MIVATRGSAKATRVITGNVHYYTVWCASDGAVTEPETATGANIRTTGRVIDESQKNFEVLVQSIGLRTMPVALDNPIAVSDLQSSGAQAVKGEGFMWRFAVDAASAFRNTASDVGLLVDEIDGIVLPNGTILRTKGPGKNIEFRYDGIERKVDSEQEVRQQSV